MQAGGLEGSVCPGKLVLLAASSYSQPEATGLRTVESDVPEGQVAAQTWRQARKKDRERERGLQSVERQTEREGEKERGRKIAAARLISFPGTPGLLLFDSGFSTIGACPASLSPATLRQSKATKNQAGPPQLGAEINQDRRGRTEKRTGEAEEEEGRGGRSGGLQSGAGQRDWLGLAWLLLDFPATSVSRVPTSSSLSLAFFCADGVGGLMERCDLTAAE